MTPLSLRLLCLLLASLVVAENPFILQNDEYKTGKLGKYPQPSFISHDVGSAPLLHHDKWDDQCATDEYVFLVPHGNTVTPELVIIHPTQGLVWHKRVKKGPNHLHVVQYKGKPYLAYWEGDEKVGIGSGSYYLLDQHYELKYEINAGHNLTGDLHSFSITPEGNALFTIYHQLQLKRDYDGFEKPEIYDGLIQEKNIETGKVVFEWRAMNHFRLQDMGTNTWIPWKDHGHKDHPWDWFHINSIVKDPWGNYLISARYSNAITYINGKNGKIIWNLGGKLNSFTDLSGGKATNFWCQHDARWTNNYTAITIFDNSAYWGDTSHASRALKVEVDTHKMTAKLLAEFKHPAPITSESQGSHQVLDNGNSLVGWGFTSAFTEYAPDGTMLCDTHFSALFNKDKKFDKNGEVQSYRAYKQKWHGYPLYNPESKLAGDRLAVSWNGATEVRKWLVSGKKSGGRFNAVGEEKKTTFETTITVGREDWESFRIRAEDEQGRSLGEWITDEKGAIIERVTSGFNLHMGSHNVNSTGSAFVFFAIVAAIALVVGRRSPRILSVVHRYIPLRQQAEMNGKPFP